jgi:lantibiotic transport system permease protein
MIRTLFRCISAEWLKIRRTLALWLCLAAPLVIQILMFTMYLRDKSYFLRTGGENQWTQFNQMAVTYWNLLILPLFIPLLTALVAQLEHSHHNWKLIYTLPNPRWAVFAAKWTLTQALLAGCVIENLIFTWLTGRLLQLIDPGFGFSAAFPLGSYLRLAFLAYLAGWLIVTIHLFIAMRSPSFVLAVGVGVVATILALFVFGNDVAYIYPWTLPGLVGTGARENMTFWGSILWGFIGGGLLTIPAGWRLSKVEVL